LRAGIEEDQSARSQQQLCVPLHEAVEWRPGTLKTLNTSPAVLSGFAITIRLHANTLGWSAQRISAQPFPTTVCQGVNNDITVSEICSEAHRSHKTGFKFLPGILLVPSLLLAARHRGISDFSFLLGPTLQEGVLLGPSC